MAIHQWNYSMKNRNILILYTELAGYTLASLNALAANRGVHIHLVRWPVNNEAPFAFDFQGEMTVYDRKSFSADSLTKLASDIGPDLILCSGWTDKAYLAVCKSWRKKIPVVLAMDNKWLGTAKQHVARLVSRFTVLRYFSHCWVPGQQQFKYAEKLGFKADTIKTGFYTCDVEHFARVNAQTMEAKSKHFPHVFVYAGRYYDFKGIQDLWEAFVKLKLAYPNDWKLICLGNGDLDPVQHSDIQHLGFVQPEHLGEIMAGSGVFVLPSRVEPWGVVVQEFAAAGFPLLLSSAVGSGEAFLQEGMNGFSFRPSDPDSLMHALRSIVELNDHKLVDMGQKSAAIATTVSPEQWTATLLGFIP